MSVWIRKCTGFVIIVPHKIGVGWLIWRQVDADDVKNGKTDVYESINILIRRKGRVSMKLRFRSERQR